ncbi:MAG TPA: isocitrate/isopropylmalate family dehydrogenase [Solirubrobacteraceae bacterium]|nr:isocitrate/isopropylmalate family dehydrogenase [Solirubrobacteraceae bacterium]
MSRAKRVVAIPGEDAAEEAFTATMSLLDGLSLDIDWTYPPVGARAIQTHGEPFPAEAIAAIDDSDAALFGATSGPSASALFYLRWGRETFANVRPTRFAAGFETPLARPEGIDLAIVRENLEDLYVASEGAVEDLAPLALQSLTWQRPVADLGPGAYALKVITERGCERVARFAFELARRRKAEGRIGKVTCATKYNMLPRTDGLFRDVAQRVGGENRDIEFEVLIVDDFAHRLVRRPQQFDVVLLPNLYGDILSDAAAALAGGLGLAASGCYGSDYAYFEPVHGTAPDLEPQQVNPTATILSAAMMLEYLGFGEAARALQTAVERVYARGGPLTADQGGSASTDQFREAVVAEL